MGIRGMGNFPWCFVPFRTWFTDLVCPNFSRYTSWINIFLSHPKTRQCL
ncbi:MAG: hypothetical protein DSM106950_18270 [Stigonema ocellatum SAG 48.90 = DSM 106950]|nr:hypothetical protein [Stigonema ocellatum SAG 48.90 = DSM 106950]